MNRKLRGSFKSDEGISVIEVVLAAFIMFFVLTAILALVATTTRVGLSARQHTAMTNAVESHLEWLRSIAFDDLLLEPDGIVPVERDYEVDGFVITITTDISEGTGRTRDVELSATATGEGFTAITKSQAAVVFDSESGIVTMLQPGDAPEVEFISPTPESDAVLYGSQVLGTSASSLYIAVRATAAEEESVIADLKMYCSDVLLRDGSTLFAEFAQWQPGTNSVDQSFRWNTLQISNDTGEETIEDGWRMVRILATDENGVQGLGERRFYVDNYPPDVPGIPNAQVYSDVQTRVSWATAMDGTDYAPFYVIRWARIDQTGALGAVNTVGALTTNVFTHTTDPFSRYTVWAASSNYRGDTTAFQEIATPYVSRTAIDGESTTYFSGTGNRRTAYTSVVLHADSPSFAVSSVRYDVYRVTPESLGLSATPPTLSDPPTVAEQDALAAWKAALAAGLRASAVYSANTGPDFSESFSKKVGNSGIPDRWYYGVKITFTPTGYRGGTSESLWTDVVGPIMLTTGTGTLAQVTW